MFDNTINSIYSAAATPELWPTALDLIANCYQSIGTVLVLSHAHGHWSSIVSPSLAAAAKDYDEWGWKLDFCMARARERAITEPNVFYTDRHLATLEEIRTHPYFTKFRTSHGLGPFLAGEINPDASVFAVLSMQGQVSRAPFTDEEVESFAGLARHVERALMLTVKLIDAETRSETFADVLSRLSCGVFLLDDNQDIVFANRVARRILEHLFPLDSASHAASAPQRKLIKETLNAATFATGSSKPMVPVLLRGAGAAGVIAFYVMPFGQTAPSAFFAARVIILAIEHDLDQPADPLIVRELLGLTQGEARLASVIGTGKSPREAAEQIGITEESARTVLKRVFLKTNTSRQSELAALLSRLIVKSAP